MIAITFGLLRRVYVHEKYFWWEYELEHGESKHRKVPLAEDEEYLEMIEKINANRKNDEPDIESQPSQSEGSVKVP